MHKKQKNRGHHQHRIIWERALPGLRCKDNTNNGIYQRFFRKSFSADRMSKYFLLYPENDGKAIKHYQCNIMLSEAMYPCLSVFEVELRNSIVRELKTFAHREDWYVVFSTTPGLMDLNKYISTAKKQITSRGEEVSAAKITAELTWGFWTSLFNRNYERILWKDLRRAFPFVQKANRQRKVVASSLNKFRRLRNRIDHNEAICWNLKEVELIHDEMLHVMGWMNKDVPVRKHSHLLSSVRYSQFYLYQFDS